MTGTPFASLRTSKELFMTHHFRLNGPAMLVGLNRIEQAFSQTPKFSATRWQGVDVTNRPQGETHELLNCLVEYDIPDSRQDLVDQVKPNLPWAEDHFQERVSGEALNPPPSNAWWPKRS